MVIIPSPTLSSASCASGHAGAYVNGRLPVVPRTVAAAAPMLPAHPMSLPSPSCSTVSGPGFSPQESINGAFTRGFPDPASVEEQKVAYIRSLEEQLEEGNKSLQRQNAERKQQLRQAAEQQKQALLLHIEQQVKMQEMELDEQTNQAMMGLKKAALDQRAALEQQAASLTLEYQQRKMQEEFAATQAEMRRQYLDSHKELQEEVQKQFAACQMKKKNEIERQHKERHDKLGNSTDSLPPHESLPSGMTYAAPLVASPPLHYASLPTLLRA